MKRKMWAVLVLLLSIWLSPSFTQEVILQQESPTVGKPICLGDVLIYRCTVQSFILQWEYIDKNLYHVFFLDTDLINKATTLGPFEVVLSNISLVGSTVNLSSTATLKNGVIADDNNQLISCSGLQQQKGIRIMVTEVNVTNARVCWNTISWDPPTCDADCTVRMDGIEIDTVPCSDGKLTITADPDPSSKTLSINATDPLGRSMLVENILVEDCPVPVSSSLVPSVSSTAMPTASSNTALVIDISVALVILVVVSFFVVAFVQVCFLKRKGNEDVQDHIHVQLTKTKSKEKKHHFYSFEVIDERHHNLQFSSTHCTVSPDAEYIVTVAPDTDLRSKLWIWKTGPEGVKLHVVDIKNTRVLKKPKSISDKQELSVDAKKLKDKYWKDGGMERLVSLNWVHKADTKMLMLTYSKFVMIYDISRSAISVVFSAQKRATYHKCKSPTPRIFCGACSPSDLTFVVSYTTELADENVCGRLELGETNFSSEQDYVELVSKEVPVISMSFSQDGKLLAAGSINGDIEVYDCTDPSQPPRTWKAHHGMVHDVQFNVHHVDDKLEMKVFSMGEDNKFCVLDMSKEKEPVKHAEFDPKQEHLFCLEPNCSAQVTEKKRVIKAFHYLARSKLFALGIENKFILIASPKGGILYQDTGNFQLKKFQELCPGVPISCVDWVFHGNIITCAMGCKVQGVHTVKMIKMEIQSLSELPDRVKVSASNTIVEFDQPLPLEGKPQQSMSAEPSDETIPQDIPATVPAAQGTVEEMKPSFSDEVHTQNNLDSTPSWTDEAGRLEHTAVRITTATGTGLGEKPGHQDSYV